MKLRVGLAPLDSCEYAVRIDTHCHIDMFNNPISIAEAYQKSGTACVLTTMLPSHYQAALQHLKPFPAISLALGMHPLRAEEGRNEIDLFIQLVHSARYIGEIGLDLSAEGKKTEKIQAENMNKILPLIRDGKFVTLHSRNAHNELAMLLDEYSLGPVCFHYFVGSPMDASKLVAKGHYFSINHRMLSTKHQQIIDVLPHNKVLVETDGPFLSKRPITSIREIYEHLSDAWGITITEVEGQLERNFKACRTRKDF